MADLGEIPCTNISISSIFKTSHYVPSPFAGHQNNTTIILAKSDTDLFVLSTDKGVIFQHLQPKNNLLYVYDLNDGNYNLVSYSGGRIGDSYVITVVGQSTTVTQISTHGISYDFGFS